VTEEVSQITRHFQDKFLIQSLSGPTTGEVLNQLTDHDIVHFACHESSNILDPSESYLLLQRRQPSEAELVPDPLTAGHVADPEPFGGTITHHRMLPNTVAARVAWRLK
jgi:CHAT domain-containing protein